MAITDRVTELVLPVLDSLELSLYDVEHHAGTLRVTVERADGLDLDQLAAATRAISRVLDEHDPMPGGYTLEVSSPGLERRLRTPAHFAGAVGETVSVKLGPHVEGERRIRGTLSEADGAEITVIADSGETHRIQVGDITKAVTVFEWGPGPKPGQAKAKPAAGDGAAATGTGAAGDSPPSDEPERRAAVR